MIKHLALIPLYFCFLGIVRAQNLIPNSGFEEKLGCPEDASHDYKRSLYHLKNWENAHRGSCDYLNTCRSPDEYSKGSFSFLGKMSAARTGEGYLGFVAFTPEAFYGTMNYREVPMVRLKQALKKGVEYELEINVKVAANSAYYISNLNIYFVREMQELVRHNASNEILVASKISKYRMLEYKQTIRDTTNWQRLTFLYTALGGETFLILGNFNTNENTAYVNNQTKAKSNFKSFCYYYIDDLWLGQKGMILAEHNFEPGFRFVLRNIHFETGSADFSKQKLYDLDKLLELMEEYPHFNINIAGHTDKEGEASFNMRLSYERAKNVKTYLMSKGLDKQRMKVQGFGSNRPRGSNETHQGKKLNRRVEIEVVRTD